MMKYILYVILNIKKKIISNIKSFIFIIVLLFVSCFILDNIFIEKNKICILKKQNIHEINQNQKYKKYNKELIHVKTDVLDVEINLKNGEICNTKLLNYHQKINSFKKLKLLNSDLPVKIINSLSLYNWKGQKSKIIHYNSDCKDYKLFNYRNYLYVPIYYKLDNLKLIKTFIFKKNSYDINIEYKLCNLSSKPMSFSINGKIKQKLKINRSFFNFTQRSIKDKFDSVAFSKNNENYQKFYLKKIINSKNFHYKANNGWVAILQKYFVISLIFDKFHKNSIYLSNKDNLMSIGYHTTPLNILPYSNKVIRSSVWIGPIIPDKMNIINHSFSSVINYGFFWFLSQPLFQLLLFLHYLVKNWGYAIILITCILRIITYPLMKFQYLATLKMRLLQPKVIYLRNKFKNNQQKLNKEIANLYLKNQVNSLSGVLPILIQMPIFLALYYTLINSIELRHAHFILWIYDLSDYDHFYILPIIMGITIFYIQKISCRFSSFESFGAKFLHYIPVLFCSFFLWLPSGLVLYYIVSNIMTIIQQIIINYDLTKKKNIIFE